MEKLIRLLNELNGWKTLLACVLAISGAWWDLRAEILTNRLDAVKVFAVTEEKLARIDAKNHEQDEAIRDLNKDIKQELKELRRDLQSARPR